MPGCGRYECRHSVLHAGALVGAALVATVLQVEAQRHGAPGQRHCDAARDELWPLTSRMSERPAPHSRGFYLWASDCYHQ